MSPTRDGRRSIAELTAEASRGLKAEKAAEVRDHWAFCRTRRLEEYREIRGRLDRIASGFPRTVGLPLSTFGYLGDARDAAAEDVARIERILRREGVESGDGWEPTRPLPKRDGDHRALTQDEWRTWGTLIRTTRDDMRTVYRLAGDVGLTTNSRPFRLAIEKLQAGAFQIDVAVRLQHPDWRTDDAPTHDETED